ncbi:5'/3'-nucleotidase SurE [Schlesneria sp.]|uniref:5'/3'-nucleotidase SurE n=1 Tax=Schlesneria sp. TaxID=2762018 RepID=UPI002EE75E63
MHILLVNDDGIHAPSLHALYAELRQWGEVTVVAPAIEQSGVGHTITYLHPLVAHKEYRNAEFFGWKVEGSPADCVKLGVLEFCPKKPDVIISGLNAGANIGINVLYSGTVAAAIEGAFFGIPSFALSQWMDGPPDFAASSRRAIPLCQHLLPKTRPGQLWNINFPPPRPGWPRGVQFVAMGVNRVNEEVEKRTDPRGRPYYWSGLNPIRSHLLDDGTDIKQLQEGDITVTPLHFDLTEQIFLKQLQAEKWDLPCSP